MVRNIDDAKSNSDILNIPHAPATPPQLLQRYHAVESNILSTMLSRTSVSPAVTNIAARALPAVAGARVATAALTQTRGLATVQDAPPKKRVYGGLKDQDRIFQNLYGHHGADLASAKKYGDWHKTKEIIQKGDDWVS